MLDRERNIKILTTTSFMLGIISALHWFVQFWKTMVYGFDFFSNDFSIWIIIVAGGAPQKLDSFNPSEL